MIEEKAVRLPTYVDGVRIRLADGQSWSFPDPPAYDQDDEHQGLLRAIGEAEDETERLRGQLALTIHLLSRNYRLQSADYEELLNYATGDPALAEMQAAVGALAIRQLRALPPLATAHSAAPFWTPTVWRLTHLVRRLKHVETS